MAKNPAPPPLRMHRENFQTALILAIEAQAGHEFYEWRMKANNGVEAGPLPDESCFLRALRDVLAASREGRKIEIEES